MVQHRSSGGTTRRTAYDQTVGNFFRMQRRRVRKDLKLFKNYIELLEDPTRSGPSRRKGEGLREDMDQQAGWAVATSTCFSTPSLRTSIRAR